MLKDRETFEDMISRCYEYADALMVELDSLNKKFAEESDKPAFDHFGLTYESMVVSVSRETTRSEFAKNFMFLLLKQEKLNEDVKLSEAHAKFAKETA